MLPGVQAGRQQQDSLADQAASMLSPAWVLPGLAWVRALIYAELPLVTSERQGTRRMTWTIPILVEICVGLEINGYLPAEF